MLLSSVSVLVVAQSSSEIQEGLMNNPVFNDQLDAQFFFVYVYFNFLHVSSIQLLIIRRFNFINTISVICHSM